MAAQPQYKLSYFDLRGLGEGARLLFALAGVPFDDIRFPIDVANGFKKPEFEEAQARGEFPFYTVPVLEVNGVKISQSKAIERYLAREFGLLGKSNLETAQIEQLSEQLVDIVAAFSPLRWSQDEAKLTEFYEKTLVEHFYTLNKNLLAEGSDITLFDVQLLNLTDALDGARAEAALAQFPNLAARRDLVAKHEKVAAYLAARKQTPF